MPQLVSNLKGGSLNFTAVYQDNDKKFVRKMISRMADREYGYVRWYSQLKKLQRFNEIIPGYVPRVLDVGTTNEGAYFDIEYVDAKDIKTIFKTHTSQEDLVKINQRLWEAFDKLHHHSYSANKSSLGLYYQEEVLQKINDARKFPDFEKFYQIDHYDYRGQKIKGMKTLFKDFEKLFDQEITSECYVHGNPTLENILYSDQSGIVFIDLYEESIVDSMYMDYSQVLQCSNSHYGMLNDGNLYVDGNAVSTDVDIPRALVDFDELFNKELSLRCDQKTLRLVKLFEATQFFRMLPFKCHGSSVNSAKYFYAHACSLVNKIL
jgi:thiamine kinase-like enzyme